MTNRIDSWRELLTYKLVKFFDIDWICKHRRYRLECLVVDEDEQRILHDANEYYNSIQTKRYERYFDREYSIELVLNKAESIEGHSMVMVDCMCTGKDSRGSSVDR